MLQIHYFSFSCSSCCGVAAAIAPAAALLGASAATDLQAGACKARVCKEAVIQCWGSKNCTSMQPNQCEGVQGVAGVPGGVQCHHLLVPPAAAALAALASFALRHRKSVDGSSSAAA